MQLQGKAGVVQMKRKRIADIVIFSGMAINVVVIVLILYFYVI